MAVDEDLLSIVPIALALVLFILAFFYILIDFQSKRDKAEEVQTALSMAQLIAARNINQAALPAALRINSSQYSVEVNLTDLRSGASWRQGTSNGSTVVSLPTLLELLNGTMHPAKIYVRLGK